MVVILRRSFSSSSLRSSIFSVRLWFSIFSCSKSMRCKPSASCSFSLTDCSSRSSLHSRLSVARPCVNVNVNNLLCGPNNVAAMQMLNGRSVWTARCHAYAAGGLGC